MFSRVPSRFSCGSSRRTIRLHGGGCVGQNSSAIGAPLPDQITPLRPQRDPLRLVVQHDAKRRDEQHQAKQRQREPARHDDARLVIGALRAKSQHLQPRSGEYQKV